MICKRNDLRRRVDLVGCDDLDLGNAQRRERPAFREPIEIGHVDILDAQALAALAHVRHQAVRSAVHVVHGDEFIARIQHLQRCSD